MKYLRDKEMIHRDVKPTNILVISESKVCLGDFGMMNKKGGTPIFCAPEQLNDTVEKIVVEPDVKYPCHTLQGSCRS